MQFYYYRNPASFQQLNNRMSSSQKVRVFLLVVLTLLVVILLCATNSTTDHYASTPFCNAQGVCGESPIIATPRTIYSAKSEAQSQKWMRFHHQLCRTAQAFASDRPLILLGDSITESWAGTSYGTTAKRAQGIPQVLQELRQALQRDDPLVLGISGDQTQHLLWRLQNGELLPSYANNFHSIFVALIGTNNLGAGELPGPTAEGVLAVLQYLEDHTAGKIVAVDVLPRGDGAEKLPELCPPRCDTNGKPFSSFLPAVDKLNQAVRAAKIVAMGERVTFLHCGNKFLQTDGRTVNASLFAPDRLHPNVQGQRVLAKCIQKGIQQILKDDTE